MMLVGIGISSGSKELVYTDLFILGNPFVLLIILILLILLILKIFYFFKREK